MRIEDKRIIPPITNRVVLSHWIEMLLFRRRLVDIDYSSTENLFQAAKCANLCDALFVAHALDSREAAMFGQGRMTLSDAHRERLIKYGANPDDFQRAKSNSWKRTASGYPLMREDWDSIKPYVMMTALRLKFDVPSVGAAIVQTGAQEAVNSLTALAARDENILLVEHVDRDRQWGDGLLGEGTNMLGKMLTQLLWEKRHGCTYPLDLAWLRRPNNTVAEYP
ncbi:hypothetical protein, variant [Capsaspora owczarzaki ATCC 30864]|uniref:Uncharacterized protein n=1 Tax=Capsaspora owczarzaki (strain ATCC 30864) TaxID=595528 RepID=A0A0D2WML4_CAPO3|nr:hypothetical protein, variant [Capsaspora owczarzaki ATCC 30864]